VSVDRIRLQIDQISKTYGTRRVLRSVSADLGEGDVLIITGRNGAGKSTLLRIIAGLLPPSQGSVHVWVDGTLIGAEQRRNVLGFVGPDVHLYRELTVREHVDLIRRLRGLPVPPATARSVWDAVGLDGREDEPVAGFSSGMMQRLRYALALMHQPRLLLLDEPTTNLDASGIALVDGIVKRAAREGIVLIATNDPRDMAYSDLVLPLDEPHDG
jgi:heme exporter protein A